ncbi:hypothetical protein [Rhodopseudomonas sp. RCAM05734]|uniref:hypothetical protein n=1 Tax=Rhodopseudomonas sp. RCAM05734 TaxID=3457549 RepID=UPI004043EDB5
MTQQLAAILADLEIEPVDTRVRRTPGQTCATSTMDRLLADHGAGHLILTLRTIMESENNRRELVAPTILAVSDIILAHPKWADTGLAFLEAFDSIDLAALRQQAKANRRAAQPRQAMATLLYAQLSQNFAPDVQGSLL